MRRGIPSGIQNGVTKDSWASPEPILGFVEKGATARQRSHTQARFERVSDPPWSGGGLVIIENGLLDNAVDKWQLHPGATDLRLISHNFFNPISPLQQLTPLHVANANISMIFNARDRTTGCVFKSPAEM